MNRQSDKTDSFDHLAESQGIHRIHRIHRIYRASIKPVKNYGFIMPRSLPS